MIDYLINQQNDIDKIYFYARYLSEPKYEYLIKKCEDAGIKQIIQIDLSNVQIRWMMFMRILMITIQSEKEKK